MTNPEAFLIAYINNLLEHGHTMMPLTIMLSKIDDAFHKYNAENDLDANGKKLYNELRKIC